ncbi:MAG: non-homologous end-joining DNA ligase [Actinomycetota bacterium]|nr:non-homologous end-joining DNA ligase [Actinomycetota bacterium]
MAVSSITASQVTVSVEGTQLSLTNLDKVLYPEAGVTKGAVLDYYRQVAPVLLAHLARRPVTFRRFPDGIDGSSFYEKHVPRGAPDFVSTIPVPTRSGALDHYPAIDSLPALIWAANLAVLEFHVPMWRAASDGQPEPPDLVVFDLDPGAPAGIVECCGVALALRARLAEDGYVPLAKTSGSKGIQLYAKRPVASRGEDPAGYAKALATELAAKSHLGVVANMRRDLRKNKVLVDWSQNSTAKTTVAPYSLRATSRVGVSTPLHWEEVEAVAGGDDPERLRFVPKQVLERIARHGDLFAPLTGA